MAGYRWRGGLKGAPYQGNPGFKPKRVPPVQQRVVACPTHGAAIGEPCITKNGKRATGCVTRRRLAVRKLREEMEAANAL